LLVFNFHYLCHPEKQGDNQICRYADLQIEGSLKKCGICTMVIYKLA
jgi:hypothetical protein